MPTFLGGDSTFPKSSNQQKCSVVPKVAGKNKIDKRGIMFDPLQLV